MPKLSMHESLFQFSALVLCAEQSVQRFAGGVQVDAFLSSSAAAGLLVGGLVAGLSAVSQSCRVKTPFTCLAC